MFWAIFLLGNCSHPLCVRGAHHTPGTHAQVRNVHEFSGELCVEVSQVVRVEGYQKEGAGKGEEKTEKKCLKA